MITKSDILENSQFKINDGTIFIIDETIVYEGIECVKSSFKGGEKGNYFDTVEDFLFFLNEKGAVKI